MADKIYLWKNGAPYSDLYADDVEQPSLTPYIAKGSRGAVVVCPGGGYSFRADHEGNPISEIFQFAGISAFTLNYRVTPKHIYSPLAEAQRAIRLVRSMGYERVAILGFSAGGHLTCSAATLYNVKAYEPTDEIDKLSARPDAFVPCYAVATMGEFTHVGSRNNLLGERKDDKELWDLFSSEKQVTDDTPPCFIWHTFEDNAVPVQNAINLARALSDHHVLFEMHIYPHGWHGIGTGTQFPESGAWTLDCKRFLLSLGFGR